MDVVKQEKKKLLLSITQLKKDIPKLQKKYPEVKARLLFKSINILGGWIEDISDKDREKRKGHGINQETVRVIQMLNNVSESIEKLIHTEKLCKYFKEPNFCSKLDMDCDIFNESDCDLFKKEEERERSKEIGKKIMDATTGFFKRNKNMVKIEGHKKREVE